MSEKRKCSTGNVCPNKRQWLTLENKLDVIKCHEDGASFAKIARDYKINESSVRAIIKKKQQYKDHGIATASYMSKTVAKNRDKNMLNMERLLLMWIEDCNKKRIPLSQLIIQEKARSLFSAVAAQNENEGQTSTTTNEEKSFNASRGWFYRFKERTKIHNVGIVGESASADIDAAAKYPDELNFFIEDGNYSDHQIFNVDETGLFWKKMPSRTYLAEKEISQPGYKGAKDRLNLLLGGNASGEFKLKPMLVYRANNPRALKGY